MRYWIIIDDRHAGPFSARQLLDTGLTADTLVWHEGLPDWVRAADVEELAEGLHQRAIAEAEARERLIAQADTYNPAKEEEEETADTAAPMQPQHHETMENACTQQQWNQPCQPQPQAATQQPSQAIAEPCPPAYIAWSIIATLLCCTIVGIPGIIFASMTKSAYYKGDIAKAKRYSELAQWFIIASIVLGAVSWPFQIAFMGMLQ